MDRIGLLRQGAFFHHVPENLLQIQDYIVLLRNMNFKIAVNSATAKKIGAHSGKLFDLRAFSVKSGGAALRARKSESKNFRLMKERMDRRNRPLQIRAKRKAVNEVLSKQWALLRFGIE